ncbi:MAG TPA: hypothetical protein DCZ95_10660 [Verrucomicrobia bacterium]|nr:MAG: hypothetical protein A2X46_18485 [Lentisphaerae bacterium GWF2_57_35]HBA84544.1 hypothetical protein [Verrucomicrobiota bacterium]
MAAGLPLAAQGWGGRLHMDINYAAARNVPDEMAAWRAYDKVLSKHSIDPDLWKGADPSEGPRHYIEPEHLKGVVFTNLPKSLSALYEKIGKKEPEETGLAPWIIDETLQRLTQVMASSNWLEATAVAAALGHYVADTHQPLHCTKDFDGDWISNRGIHLRWEKEMPAHRWNYKTIQAGPARYVDDPWNVALIWMHAANQEVQPIFKADRAARRQTDNDVVSEKYFDLLWASSKDLFAKQVNQSVTDVSSLWYTAWVNAGKPPIPPPPETIDGKTIFRPGEARRFMKTSFPWTLVVVLGSVAALVLVLGVVKRQKRPLDQVSLGS